MLCKALMFFFISLVVACSSAKKSTGSVTVDISQSESIEGLGLMAKNDCITCHKVHEKVIGPSFLSVANKYDKTNENISRLSEKIKEGGKGSWGNVPMVPHKDLSREEAELIVKYILSLKNN